MKKYFLLFFVTILWINAFTQTSTSQVPISETFSPNLKYKIKSISYDHENPNLKGISTVIKNSGYNWKDTLYKINRSFDLMGPMPFHLFLSNDGKKVAYFIDRPYYDGEENKSVTIYENGKFLYGYTSEEFNRCDKDKEKCELFYNNSGKVKDWIKSNAVLTVFKDDTSEQERFLYDNYIFNKNDTIYVIDSRKRVTIFDLNRNKIVANNILFDSIYPQIKNYRKTGGTLKTYEYPFKYVNDLEDITNNKKLSESIGEIFNLKYISQNDSTWRKYKLYKTELFGYLNRNGKFEVEKIEVENPLEREPILNYLNQTKFKIDFIPYEVDKLYMLRFFGGYRSFDNAVAQKETEKEKAKQRLIQQRNLVADSIDHFYIPKNMQECINELDKVLNFDNKKEIKEAKDLFVFTSHMSGLGMWIRNNWGLNGGSRLIKYFQDRNIGKSQYGAADEISAYIVKIYSNWLKGNKNAAMDFEKEYPKINK